MIRTRLWQSSTAIFLALLFWISVVVFPTGPHEISDSARRFTLVVASILGLAAVVVAFMNQRDQTKKKHYRYWEGTYNASTNPGTDHQLQLVVDFEGTRRYDLLDSTFDETFLTGTVDSL